MGFLQGFFAHLGYLSPSGAKAPTDTRVLKGIFNAIPTLERHLDCDPHILIDNVSDLCVHLSARSWYESVSLASYVAYGLTTAAILPERAQAARDFVRGNLAIRAPPSLRDLTPDVCLACPELLLKVDSKEAEVELKSLSFYQIAHVLLGIQALGSDLIATLHQKSEQELTDRLVTVLEGHGVWRGIEDLVTSLREAGCESQSRTEEDLNRLRTALTCLSERFAKIDAVSLACYALHLSREGEDKGHFLKASEYRRIETCLKKRGVCVSNRLELIMELAAIGWLALLAILLHTLVMNMSASLGPTIRWLLKGVESAGLVAIFYLLSRLPRVGGKLAIAWDRMKNLRRE